MEWLTQHFEIILCLAVLLCGVAYFYDRHTAQKELKHLEKVFRAGAETAQDRYALAMRLSTWAKEKKITPRPAELDPDDQSLPNALPIEVRLFNVQQKLVEQKRLDEHEFWWVQHRVGLAERFVYGFADCFVILLVILVLRSFVAEPHLIPSGSMEPNLYDGDFILTTKYDYGIKLPVLGTTILETGKPKRGDIVVFRYPNNPQMNYIKRVVGLPGDTLTIVDGQIVANDHLSAVKYQETGMEAGLVLAQETFLPQGASNHQHQVQFSTKYRARGQFHLTVPEGKYFVMGDNRDFSDDSRGWGYVPEENLLGKARFIWLNTGCFTFSAGCKRIGKVLQ